jgi:hypothetical protein
MNDKKKIDRKISRKEYYEQIQKQKVKLALISGKYY